MFVIVCVLMDSFTIVFAREFLPLRSRAWPTCTCRSALVAVTAALCALFSFLRMAPLLTAYLTRASCSSSGRLSNQSRVLLVVAMTYDETNDTSFNEINQINCNCQVR